ncbi:uncharacterized protein METZ01_LOCUS160812 [marine metagenome]|uniref:IrrE N-terminal-like domain-containing protein n=1 Tax=marine metagenome TaxID=408172 RepID=A0A382B2I6_9ZZZZ
MTTKEKAYPYLKNSTIEKESAKLLESFCKDKGQKIAAPVPVFDIIEYLGYDVDFRKDGIYEDKNLLGGTLIDQKTIEINENLIDHEGRMHFTAAHEVGHIVLHVPFYNEKHGKDVSEHKIISRKDCGFEGTKKEPEEWQADKFAAYLLMPSALIKKAFYNNYNRPVNVRRKSILQIFFPKPAFVKGYRIAEEVIRDGKFDNVSKMAMLNRLIGMRLVKGLSYQKSITTQ